MARLNLQKVLAMAALGACSCAASQTPPAQSAAPNEPAQGSTTTTLTNAEVPTTEVPAVESPPIPSPLVAPTPVEPETMAPTARWTDAEIVGALGAAQAGRDADAKLARTRSKSVRVDRFAEDVLQQERELTHDESGFARSMGSLPSDLESQVDGARHAAAISAIETTGLSFDRDYITAELRYERTLIHLIEDEMLPSARAPELRRFLETLHAKTARRISAAEEIESKIP